MCNWHYNASDTAFGTEPFNSNRLIIKVVNTFTIAILTSFIDITKLEKTAVISNFSHMKYENHIECLYRNKYSFLFKVLHELKAVNFDHMLILQCKIAKNTVTVSVKIKHFEE